MISAVIFDFYGVLEDGGKPNEELLSYIRKDLYSHYKLGVISNSDTDFFHETLAKDDADMFDEIVLSYQVGLMKPGAEIYELTLKRLGVEPAQAIFIDDLEQFCEAARALGTQAIAYKDFATTKKDLEALLAPDSNN